MPTIRTAIAVDAPTDVVWDVLADVESYPAWNPHVTRVDGALVQGGTVEVTVHRAGARDRRFPVRVTEVEPGTRLAWVGTVLTPWLFEGRHVFELEQLDGGRTRLHNREEVSGLLAPLLLTDEPDRDYEAMNRALKERAERLAAG